VAAPRRRRATPNVCVQDVYVGHRIDRVIATAKANSIEFLFVPPCGVVKFQPVDRQMFGDLETLASADIRRLLNCNKKFKTRLFTYLCCFFQTPSHSLCGGIFSEICLPMDRTRGPTADQRLAHDRPAMEATFKKRERKAPAS
jgi:hypothetical protein